jgi:hypothetical protein
MNPGASLASTCTIATRPRRLAQSLSRGSDTRGITDPAPLRVLLPHACSTLVAPP